jgi:hypothetical protein
MINPVLNETVRQITQVLTSRYGSCGVADGDTKTLIHAFPEDGKTIYITIEEKEDACDSSPS